MGTEEGEMSRARRQHEKWRKRNGIIPRCDSEGCSLHSGDLRWAGGYVELKLDHINGDAKNDQLENVRLLCPNCWAQKHWAGVKL